MMLSEKERKQYEKEFMRWWDKHGQYVRAGGGQYEICFAYAAYMAAIEKMNKKRKKNG